MQQEDVCKNKALHFSEATVLTGYCEVSNLRQQGNCLLKHRASDFMLV